MESDRDTVESVASVMQESGEFNHNVEDVEDLVSNIPKPPRTGLLGSIAGFFSPRPGYEYRVYNGPSVRVDMFVYSDMTADRLCVEGVIDFSDVGELKEPNSTLSRVAQRLAQDNLVDFSKLGDGHHYNVNGIYSLGGLRRGIRGVKIAQLRLRTAVQAEEDRIYDSVCDSATE